MPNAPHATECQILSDEAQIALSQHAMRRAALIIADQAELFGRQFTNHVLNDRGAADALTLFAALLRATAGEGTAEAGNA